MHPQWHAPQHANRLKPVKRREEGERSSLRQSERDCGDDVSQTLMSDPPLEGEYILLAEQLTLDKFEDVVTFCEVSCVDLASKGVQPQK